MSDVRRLAADLIEPHIRGDFKRRERAERIAVSLDDAGHLRGAEPRSDARERTAAHLHCVMDWPVAEQVAADLDDADLLAR